MEQKNIYAAFVKAQQGFSPALKTSLNPHFKSKYADLAACVEAVIDALNANGIGLVQKSHPDDSGVTIETLFIHTSGESMSGGTLHVPASKHDAQGYGSALSYARRYSLMAACGIAPEDDDGNAATKAPPVKAAAPASAKPITRDVFDNLDPETQEWLRNHAMEAIAFHVKGRTDEAFDYLASLELDADMKTAISSQFDAPMRSALKKISTAMKEVA